MVDLNIVNPFITAAVETLKVQGGLPVEAGKPFIKGRVAQPSFAIAGTIGVVSDQFKGVVTICFEEPFYLKMMSNMLGEELTVLNDEIQDGAAEILNIIYGTAKATINSKGYNLQKAIPSVMRGTDLHTAQPGSVPTIVIPIRVAESGMQCHIEVSVDMQ
jgi:chemotaxis protein CheX